MSRRRRQDPTQSGPLLSVGRQGGDPSDCALWVRGVRPTGGPDPPERTGADPQVQPPRGPRLTGRESSRAERIQMFTSSDRPVPTMTMTVEVAYLLFHLQVSTKCKTGLNVILHRVSSGPVRREISRRLSTGIYGLRIDTRLFPLRSYSVRHRVKEGPPPSVTYPVPVHRIFRPPPGVLNPTTLNPVSSSGVRTGERDSGS